MAHKGSKPIDVATIKRYQDALNYMLTFEKNGFVTSEAFNTMRKSHKISTNALTGMSRCGYLKMVKQGYYKVILPKLDPIHARNVIDACKDIYNSFAQKKKEDVVVNKKEESKSLPEVNDKKEKGKSLFQTSEDNIIRYQVACQEIINNVRNCGRVLASSDLGVNSQITKAMCETGVIKKVGFRKYEALTFMITRDQAESVLKTASSLSSAGIKERNRRRKGKKSKQEKDFPKQTDIFDHYAEHHLANKQKEKKSTPSAEKQTVTFSYPLERPAVKIHKKEGTIEVPKEKFLTAEVKPKQTRTRKPKRTFSLFWGLIKFNY